MRDRGETIGERRGALAPARTTWARPGERLERPGDRGVACRPSPSYRGAWCVVCPAYRDEIGRALATALIVRCLRIFSAHPSILMNTFLFSRTRQHTQNTLRKLERDCARLSTVASRVPRPTASPDAPPFRTVGPSPHAACRVCPTIRMEASPLPHLRAPAHLRRSRHPLATWRGAQPLSSHRGSGRSRTPARCAHGP